MWLIIGGSGFGQFRDFEVIDSHEVVTPFGVPSAPIKRVKVAGQEALFLPRHGEGHRLPPSYINYRANIYAAKMLGTSKILSISAVGSLRAELKPGDCVFPSQYIDRTKSIREQTFCEDGLVGHVSLAEPVDLGLMRSAQENLTSDGFALHFDKTAICIEGPAFSTKAESHCYRQMGADIIGMTNYPEYALAREAGMYYFPMSFVTDYDCWKDDEKPVDLATVIQVMKDNNQKAYHLASQLIAVTAGIYQKGCPELGLKQNLFCAYSELSSDLQKKIEAL